jgi:hypothetical protein
MPIMGVFAKMDSHQDGEVMTAQRAKNLKNNHPIYP